MFDNIKLFAIALIFLALTNCATLQLEKPQISIVGFSSNPPSGLELSFNLKLKVANPNTVPLPLAGMSYQISLNNISVLKGISKDLPTIQPFAEEFVNVNVSTSILSAPKLLLQLLSSPAKDIRYQFRSKVNLKGSLLSFNIDEQGIIPFPPRATSAAP